MKFVGYFWLSMFIGIAVYLTFVGYMIRNHPNHFKGVPPHLMEIYNERYK